MNGFYLIILNLSKISISPGNPTPVSLSRQLLNIQSLRSIKSYISRASRGSSPSILKFTLFRQCCTVYLRPLSSLFSKSEARYRHSNIASLVAVSSIYCRSETKDIHGNQHHRESYWNYFTSHCLLTGIARTGAAGSNNVQQYPILYSYNHQYSCCPPLVSYSFLSLQSSHSNNLYGNTHRTVILFLLHSPRSRGIPTTDPRRLSSRTNVCRLASSSIPERRQNGIQWLFSLYLCLSLLLFLKFIYIYMSRLTYVIRCSFRVYAIYLHGYRLMQSSSYSIACASTNYQ